MKNFKPKKPKEEKNSRNGVFVNHDSFNSSSPQPFSTSVPKSNVRSGESWKIKCQYPRFVVTMATGWILDSPWVRKAWDSIYQHLFDG